MMANKKIVYTCEECDGDYEEGDMVTCNDCGQDICIDCEYDHCCCVSDHRHNFKKFSLGVKK